MVKIKRPSTPTRTRKRSSTGSMSGKEFVKHDHPICNCGSKKMLIKPIGKYCSRCRFELKKY